MVLLQVNEQQSIGRNVIERMMPPWRRSAMGEAGLGWFTAIIVGGIAAGWQSSS
jgi:hypothetical protein